MRLLTWLQIYFSKHGNQNISLIPVWWTSYMYIDDKTEISLKNEVTSITLFVLFHNKYIYIYIYMQLPVILLVRLVKPCVPKGRKAFKNVSFMTLTLYRVYFHPHPQITWAFSYVQCRVLSQDICYMCRHCTMYSTVSRCLLHVSTLMWYL